MKWDGSNSIMMRHEQEERSKERITEVQDEPTTGNVCEKCHRHTVVNEFICLKTNTPLTPYCKQAGGPGCIFGRIGQCQGSKMIRVCQRNKCGKIQEAKE